MAEQQVIIKKLTRNLFVFRGLSDREIEKILAVAQIEELGEGQILSLEGDQLVPLYILLNGRVEHTVLASRGEIEKKKYLKAGEFFGADFYFYGIIQSVKVATLRPTQMLLLTTSSLNWLFQEIPDLKVRFKAASDMYRLVHSRHFQWLNEDEVTQMIMRKHPAYLLVSLILPIIIGWVAVGLFLGASYVETTSFRLAMEWIGFGVLFVAAGFGFWQYLDWSNDYYVITDQRIAWVEQVIGIYDSRQESPLTAVKSNEINTNLLGRTLGYGNVVINAFMGQVHFRHIGSPERVKALLDEEQRKASENLQKADTAAMEQVIRKKIDPPPEAEETIEEEQPVAPETPPAKPKKPPISFWVRLSRYFKTRIEDGDVITYRKHWFILLRKTWIPDLILLSILIATILGVRFLTTTEGEKAISIWIVLLLSIFSFGATFMWWLYQFVDWRNDIYQITADKIIDSEKKPLGDELTKSAPLGNIQSMDYQRRGLLGIILNFGDVIINVGTETKFTFDGVQDPARAQQDVFNRMYDFQRKRQVAEAAKQWDQVSDWLAAYHRQAEDLRLSSKDGRKSKKSG
jgi:hypothetical protein